MLVIAEPLNGAPKRLGRVCLEQVFRILLQALGEGKGGAPNLFSAGQHVHQRSTDLAGTDEQPLGQELNKRLGCGRQHRRFTQVQLWDDEQVVCAIC